MLLRDIVRYLFAGLIVCPLRGHGNITEWGDGYIDSGGNTYCLGCFNCQNQNITGQVGVFPGFFLVQVKYGELLHDYCIMRRVRGKKNAEMILRNPKGTLWENGMKGIMKVIRIPQSKMTLYLWMDSTNAAEELLKGE